MKKLILFTACSLWTLASWSQLMAPTLSEPSNGSTIVDVNIRLEWNPALGGTVSGYQAEIDTDSSFSNPTSLPVLGTAAKTDELDYNQLYYWRVRAIASAGGFGPWSNPWKFTTFHDEFTGLGPNGPDKNPAVNLTWDTVAGTVKYHYEYDEDSLFGSPIAAHVTHDPINFNSTEDKVIAAIQDLAFGQKYFYRVAAEHNKDQSGWSAVNSFTVTNTITQLSPLDSTINLDPEMELKCKNTPGVTEYRFALDDSTDFDPSHSSFILLTAFDIDFNGQDIKVTHERLIFGHTYYWRVQGVNNTNTSGWSETWSFTVLDEVSLVAPVNGATELDTKDGIEFVWKKINGAEHYEMQYDTINTFMTSTHVVTTGDTANSVNLTLDKRDSPYFWRVRAIHSKDTSNWSTVYTFNTLATGITEFSQNYSFSLFPNPASDVLNIDFNAKQSGNLTMEVYNIVGEKLDFVNLGHVNGNETLKYDLSSLNKGIYMLVLDLNGEKVTRRLSVK